jgi:hypothetical protein
MSMPSGSTSSSLATAYEAGEEVVRELYIVRLRMRVSDAWAFAGTQRPVAAYSRTSREQIWHFVEWFPDNVEQVRT